MRKSYFIVWVTLFSSFVVAIVSMWIFGRWDPFRALKIGAVASIFWIVWVSYVCWLTYKRYFIFARGNHPSMRAFVAIIVSLVAVWPASRVGKLIGGAIRSSEVNAAVKAGLRKDCMALMLQWPVQGDRIEEGSREYANLPNSIKMLSPVYVLNERVNDTNAPFNIGICKNGWGGFAFGVRVFKTEEDASRFRNGECQRIVPCVYICWQNT